MPTSDKRNPTLRSKSPQEQGRIAEALISASKESRFPLIPVEMRILSQFVAHIRNRQPVDDTLLMAEHDLVQRYEKHLMAPARGDL